MVFRDLTLGAHFHFANCQSRLRLFMALGAFGYDDYDHPDTLEIERRAGPRYAARLTMLCQNPGDPEAGCWAGRIRDVSADGIALEMNRRLDVGTFLRLRLDPPSRGVPHPLNATVVHATHESGPTYVVGCALERPLTDTEFQTLVPGSWIEL
jgi:hypothetical protein